MQQQQQQQQQQQREAQRVAIEQERAAKEATQGMTDGLKTLTPKALGDAEGPGF